MNSKYLGMALGASMSLCAPALASAATLTIDDLTDSVSFSFTGFTSFGAITSGESGNIIGSYTSTTPPAATASPTTRSRRNSRQSNGVAACEAVSSVSPL